MMLPTEMGVQDLRREYPEWTPWLAVVEEVLTESANSKWDSFVPERALAHEQRTPLLAGMKLKLDRRELRRWTQRLISTACQSGAPKMSTLKAAKDARIEAASLFEASLCQDEPRLRQTGSDLGVDPDAFQAVAGFIALPFLQACGRRWMRVGGEAWSEGYCPICGAWPAFAETRGIERSRSLRCGRCGGDWRAHRLICPYCGMNDHDRLLSLVPESNDATRTIEACKRCLGYLKSFTTLQGSPPAKVIVVDLSSVDLDVAACEQGYRRPQGPGYPLQATVSDNGST